MSFGLFWKHHFSSKNYTESIFGIFLNKLVHFLFFQLFTLLPPTKQRSLFFRMTENWMYGSTRELMSSSDFVEKGGDHGGSSLKGKPGTHLL